MSFVGDDADGSGGSDGGGADDADADDDVNVANDETKAFRCNPLSLGSTTV